MSDYVLDASAMLAVLKREPGAEAVEPILSEAFMSAVNVCETVTKLVDFGMAFQEATIRIEVSGITVVSFDARAARQAAGLRTLTRPFGLSLGDRACPATAIAMTAVAVTADRAWAELPLDAEIQVIR